MATNNILLIHGLWMTPLSLEYWAHHYTERGYQVYAPSWPGMGQDIRSLRRAPETYAGIGIRQVVDHYERLVLELEDPPIIIGHCFGGLVVQALLDRGLGACGVAVASAPIKGVWTLPYSTMRVVTPQLINLFNLRRSVPLSPAQFHYAFMNNATAGESLRIYERYAVPGPERVLFQVELANLNPYAATAVNVRRNSRAPLLFVSGALDHLAPPALVAANVRAYRRSQAITEYRNFPGRTHFIIGQSGWQEVANYALDWVRDQEMLRQREARRVTREMQSRRVA